MSDVAARYRRLAAAFSDKIRSVPAEKWDAPSPCEGWTALDVVRHLIDVHRMFLGFVGRELGEVPPVEDGPPAAFEAARHVVQAGLDDADRAAESFDGYFGRTTFAEAVDRFVCFDSSSTPGTSPAPPASTSASTTTCTTWSSSCRRSALPSTAPGCSAAGGTAGGRRRADPPPVLPGPPSVR
ncbi:MAG TPA: maleylpyruvate isomerase N-terminal domain-containing protein [Acidimicrobiales bacterium]|nr:maleylpyruvate isomerase N-terminal domain-containing protein [Acidimicrobiales bacterium]